MGFKNITQMELKIKQGPSFLGIPQKVVGQIQKEEVKVGLTTAKMLTEVKQLSEIIIENEEVLEFNLQHEGKMNSVEGYGNISIFNNSDRDRIWDTRIQFSGTEFSSLESENDMNLGIFEPKTSRNIKYNLIDAEKLPDLLKIRENIEIIENDVLIFRDTEEGSKEKNHLLLFGNENQVRFILNIENISKNTITNIDLKKTISKSFYGLRFEGETDKYLKISGNNLQWSIKEIRPRQKITLSFIAKITPKSKENVRTGKIDVSYTLKDHVISGVKVNNFWAYSHAMHSIDKIEKDETPNTWACSLTFKNQSSFPMRLNSILVTDKSNQEKYLDLDLTPKDREVIIKPGERYNSKVWEISDENEPRFSRKLEYYVNYKLEENTDVILRIDDDIFKIVGIKINKKMSEQEIKSFEESTIHVNIKLENMGTIPLKGIVIKESIPEDFLPPFNISDYKFLNSTGELDSNNFNLKISPEDENASKPHVIEISNKSELSNVINTNDFFEVNYSFKAISPDNKKDYKFPLEVKSFYHKFKADEELKDFKFEDKADLKVFYIKEEALAKTEEAPTLKIAHKRRKASIGKEIFPGKNHDEFAIVINVSNKSNVELT
ncbi:MAG: hypothetical protein ACFFAT_17610, partial [Promethearchaeota archaeon]